MESNSKYRITDGRERGVFRVPNFFNLNFLQPYNLLFGSFDTGHMIRLSPIGKAPPPKEQQADKNVAANAPDGVWIAVGYFVVLSHTGPTSPGSPPPASVNVGAWYADNLTDAIAFYESVVDELKAETSTFSPLSGTTDVRDYLIPHSPENFGPPPEG